MQPLSLLWHQHVSIASIIEKIWQTDNINSVPGVLLADEVGVGKTAQVIGTIAFMINVYGQTRLPVGRPYHLWWIWISAQSTRHQS